MPIDVHVKKMYSAVVSGLKTADSGVGLTNSLAQALPNLSSNQKFSATAPDLLSAALSKTLGNGPALPSEHVDAMIATATPGHTRQPDPRTRT